VLIEGLAANGVEVIECHDDHPVKPLRLPRLAARYLKMARAVDVIVVGACGHAYVPLASLLARLTGKPLVFDAFVSQYDSLVWDRKTVAPQSWKARYYFALDKVSGWLADRVLLDTVQHSDFYARTFGLSASKFRSIFIGADTQLFYPRPRQRESREFRAVFVGTFIPLQGVSTILEAAQRLASRPDIRFQLAGDGQTFPAAVAHAQRLGLRNVAFLGNVPAERVPALVADADVCLGIFGETDKARRVIPNKVYEAMAMARPVITGESEAARALLTHRENAWLVPLADPDALAQAVLELQKDVALRERIAQAGHKAFLAAARPELLGLQLATFCRELTTSNGTERTQ
jgi:glycosyltransferase involved in cell wall biosynthesis